MSRQKILLVDHYPLFLEVIADILQPEFEIVGSLTSGALVTDKAAEVRPDIILLDLSLGQMSGLDVARALKAGRSTARIVFLTVHQDPELVRAAAELGASAYVFKSQISTTLLRVLRGVLRGEEYFPYRDRVPVV